MKAGTKLLKGATIVADQGKGYLVRYKDGSEHFHFYCGLLENGFIRVSTKARAARQGDGGNK